MTIFRKHCNSSDSVCYICNELKFVNQKMKLIPIIKKAYEHYF